MKESRKLCLFAGTTEGRRLAEILETSGIRTDVYVATEYGREEIPDGVFIRTRAGRLDAGEMEACFKEKKYDLVLDATHPFARQVSENIRLACEAAGTERIRVLRTFPAAGNAAKEDSFRNGRAGEENAGVPSGSCVTFSTLEEAAAFLGKTRGNILAATGSRELAAYKTIPDWEERVYARVLSLPEVVEACGKMGFRGRHLMAMQGPFSVEMNLSMLNSVEASWLVTKESGPAGGFYEKAEAARLAGAGLVVIGKPAEEGLSVAETVRWLKIRLGLPVKEPLRMVRLVGAGPGDPEFLTGKARKVLMESQLIAGAGRLVDSLGFAGKPVLREYRPEKVLEFLDRHPEYEEIAVVFSGDPGFYSGAGGFRKALKDRPEFGVETVPGISSVSSFFAALGDSYENVCLASLHGRPDDILAAAARQKRLFLLAGEADTLKKICGLLLAAGLNQVRMTVGENLSLPSERLFSGTPEELKNTEISPLSVIYLENPAASETRITPGFPDSDFLRGEVPMTKQEVRAVSLAKLGLRAGAVVYDIGAGTGSVAAECARVSESIRVYAVERKPEALELLEKNRKHFLLPNLTIVPGEAPEALRGLPAPTHVFIGGSGGKLKEILTELLSRNRKVRIVLNVITLESLAVVSEFLKSGAAEDAEIVQISVSRSRKAGSSHLMTGQNPVWIISFSGSGTGEEQNAT